VAKVSLPANACQMAEGVGEEAENQKDLWKPKVGVQNTKPSTGWRQICILGAARDLEVIGFSIFARLEDDSKALRDVAEELGDVAEGMGTF
jgi:hypothetical protein